MFRACLVVCSWKWCYTKWLLFVTSQEQPETDNSWQKEIDMFLCHGSKWITVKKDFLFNNRSHHITRLSAARTELLQELYYCVRNVDHSPVNCKMLQQIRWVEKVIFCTRRTTCKIPPSFSRFPHRHISC